MEIIRNNNKIRLCYIMPAAYPRFNQEITGFAGGAEIDVYNQTRKLASSGGYDIKILVGDFGQKDEETYDDVNLIKLKYLTIPGKSVFKKIVRKMALVHQLFNIDADIFVAKAAQEMVGWMALIEKIIRRKIFIYRFAHDIEVDLKAYKNSLPGGWLQKSKDYCLFKYGLYHADALVAQTGQQQRMLKQNTGLESQVIRNGFFLSEPSSNIDKHNILWVGRAVEFKRPELFIELARQLPLNKFIMILPPDSYEPERSRKVIEMIQEQTNNMANVQVLGYVAFSEIQDYFNRAKLFVNTSDIEGFPNTFIQACLGSTPILSFNISPDNFINKYRLGFYCENDMEKAVDFIKNLTDEEVAFYGRNALQYVTDYHDIDKISKQYNELFRKLLLQG